MREGVKTNLMRLGDYCLRDNFQTEIAKQGDQKVMYEICRHQTIILVAHVLFWIMTTFSLVFSPCCVPLLTTLPEEVFQIYEFKSITFWTYQQTIYAEIQISPLLCHGCAPYVRCLSRGLILTQGFTITTIAEHRGVTPGTSSITVRPSSYHNWS